MSPVRRREYIRAMLHRLRDSMAQGSLGTPLEGHDSRLLLFPPEHNQALRELVRCLDVMRSEPVLRWHTVAWYVDVDSRQVPRFRFVQKRNGDRARIPAGWMLETRRDAAADESKADIGVGWISDRYSWGSVHLRAIQEAAGEFVRAA